MQLCSVSLKLTERSQIKIFSPSSNPALNAVYVLDPTVLKEAVSLAQHKAAVELHSFHGFHVKHTVEKEHILIAIIGAINFPVPLPEGE